jgi:hypothetical protein
MDTSELYIEMSRKAVKIQELIEKPTTGRYVYDGKFCVDENDRLWLADDKVCLLRQDQLQELSGKSNLAFFYRFNSFVKHYIVNILDDLAEDLDVSFEILKLMFIMKEKFNKVWDGKDWREEK